MAINKVVIGNRTVMDISNTTAEAAQVLKKNGENEVYFYDKNGVRLQGACEYNCNTTGDTVDVTHVKYGDTFHRFDGSSATGTLTWEESVKSVVLGDELPSALGAAYYPSVTFSINTSVIKSDVIAKDAKILGVTGTFEGNEKVYDDPYILAKTDYDPDEGTRYDVTLPSSLGDYTAFRKVSVGKIWYTESLTEGTTGNTAIIQCLSKT